MTQTKDTAIMRVYHVPDKLPDAEECVSGNMRVPNSLFLAGPTPRSNGVKSWRPGTLSILRECGFRGSVFVPESAEWGWCGDYQRQVEWEWDALGRAARVLFWIPRDLQTMPAFTTNIEFGMMVGLRGDGVILGSPEGSPKNRYLESVANNYARFAQAFPDRLPAMHPELDKIPVYHNLKDALLHGARNID